MEKNIEDEIKNQGFSPEITEEISNEELPQILPSMNINLPSTTEEKPQLITDNQLRTIYEEILINLRNDRLEIDQVLSSLVEMVINEGDSSSASKEAMVNCLKIKSDTADKMAKIADLMTRVKLKEKDTFPKYLAFNQNNKTTIGKISKRNLLQELNDNEDEN